MSFSADRLLRFSSVAAGGSGHWHIYYGRYYVGSIQHLSGAWCVRHHGIHLGRFAELEGAQRVVVEWYYGPASAADTCDAAPSAAWPAAEPVRMYGNDVALGSRCYCSVRIFATSSGVTAEAFAPKRAVT